MPMRAYSRFQRLSKWLERQAAARLQISAQGAGLQNGNGLCSLQITTASLPLPGGEDWQSHSPDRLVQRQQDPWADQLS